MNNEVKKSAVLLAEVTAERDQLRWLCLVSASYIRRTVQVMLVLAC